MRRGAAALFIALAVGILVLALQPQGSSPPLLLHIDKLAHAGAFAALALVGARTGLRPWPLALLLLAYGVAIEVAQGVFTTTRDASAADVLADAAGIALGWWLLRRRAAGTDPSRLGIGREREG